MDGELSDDGMDPLAALERLRDERFRRDADTVHLLDAGLSRLLYPLRSKLGGGVEALVVRWPTRQEVMKEYNERRAVREPADPKRTHQLLQARWASMPDFYYDLLGWGLHEGQLLAHRTTAGMLGQMLDSPLAELVDVVAVADMRALLESNWFLLQLIATGFAEAAPEVRKSLAREYEVHLDFWCRAYEQTLRYKGLALRGGITTMDFTMTLAAIIEGIGVQYLARPEHFGTPEAAGMYLAKLVKVVMVGAVVADRSAVDLDCSMQQLG